MPISSKVAALVALVFMSGVAGALVSIVLSQGGVEKTCTTVGDVVVSAGEVRAAVIEGCLSVETGGENEVPASYNLTVAANGTGTVASAPSGINCGNGGTACTSGFAGGSSVTLTASPSSGWNFSAWQGCGSSSGANCTVTMTNHRNVTATFVAAVSGGSTTGAYGTGFWSPDVDAKPQVIVVDQSGESGASTTIVPGCVNGGSVALGASCRTVTEYPATVNGTPVTVKLTEGQIISVRYPVAKTTAIGSTGTLTLANSFGGSIGVKTKISLSPSPGDMNGAPYCVHETSINPTIGTGTKPASCKIDRSKSMYFLNIQVQQACSGPQCVFYISENSSEFL